MSQKSRVGRIIITTIEGDIYGLNFLKGCTSSLEHIQLRSTTFISWCLIALICVISISISQIHWQHIKYSQENTNHVYKNVQCNYNFKATTVNGVKSREKCSKIDRPFWGITFFTMKPRLESCLTPFKVRYSKFQALDSYVAFRK